LDTLFNQHKSLKAEIEKQKEILKQTDKEMQVVQKKSEKFESAEKQTKNELYAIHKWLQKSIEQVADNKAIESLKSFRSTEYLGSALTIQGIEEYIKHASVVQKHAILGLQNTLTEATTRLRRAQKIADLRSADRPHAHAGTGTDTIKGSLDREFRQTLQDLRHTEKLANARATVLTQERDEARIGQLTIKRRQGQVDPTLRLQYAAVLVAAGKQSDKLHRQRLDTIVLCGAVVAVCLLVTIISCRL